MKSYTLKPFDDKGYVSEEEALKWAESLPEPKKDGDGKPDAPPPATEPDTPDTDNSNLESRILQLDNQPADNGSKKTQDQWIDYWNNIDAGSIIKDKRIFASMPDYYVAFKHLKKEVEHGLRSDKEFAQKIVDSLREDFDWTNKSNWLISSTRIKYQPNKEDAQIIHHYDCNKKLAIKSHSLLIPEYLGVLINDVLNNAKGLTYIQTFLGTKDNKDAIIKNLEFISNKPKSEIKVWTPPFTHNTYTTRSQRPERASGFGYGNGGFHVLGDDLFSNGRSRGVLVGPR